MRSRADVRPASAAQASDATVASALRMMGAVLHAFAFVCMALLLWRLITPVRAQREVVRVSADGRLDLSLADALRSAPDTLDVQMIAAPDARARAVMRTLRGSGRVLRVRVDAPLPPVAVSVEDAYPLAGGSRIQIVGADAVRAAVADAAGLIDSATLARAGTRTRSGPVQGDIRVGTHDAQAAVSPLSAGAPIAARVLVIGGATWESRFLIATLEEAGWLVDASVTVSPKVTVTQGTTRRPSRNRHSIVVVLPGGSAAALASLPSFVRGGGGLVIVGEAARSARLASLRPGVPGAIIAGEAGAETSADARRGLDLVSMTALSEGSVTLESRDGNAAVVARRIGAGRVVQVGYDNSWLWRMAGNDDAPVAHRRWWTAILAGVVPLRAPASRLVRDPAHDTLDAAPIAAIARDIGMPEVRTARVMSVSPSLASQLDVRWLLALALVSLVASWTLRRWRGLA